MRKIILIFYILLLPTITTNSAEDLPTNIKATREYLLEDATIDLLQPHLYVAVQDHYRTTNRSRSPYKRVKNLSWSYEMKPSELQELGICIGTLPTDLDHAPIALGKDKITQEALGKHIFTNFMAEKKLEWKNYRITVHPWEVEQYMKMY